MPRKKYLWFAILLTGAIYIGSYFAVLELPASIRLDSPLTIFGASNESVQATYVEINGERQADFHGLPRSLFAPIHCIDRRLLRHDYWVVRPRNQELNFDWLLGKAPAPSERR